MSYSPKRGDIVSIDFFPQSGREQDKRRPALVLSDSSYNEKVGLCIVCPITSVVKGYNFEVALPENFIITGVVLSDQVKSLDYRARRADFIIAAPNDVLESCLDNVAELLRL